MKFAIALVFLSALLPATGRPSEIVLKSGARGSLAVSVIEAPKRFGGPSAGNMIGLTVTVTSERSAKPHVDASSLCQRYGKSSYARMQSDHAFIEATNNLIDLNAPLVGVRVSFRRKTDGPVAVAWHSNFDMSGIVKCRPHSQPGSGSTH